MLISTKTLNKNHLGKTEMLTNEQKIYLNSIGYGLYQSDLDGNVEYNLTDEKTGFIKLRTSKLSVMMKYINGMMK